MKSRENLPDKTITFALRSSVSKFTMLPKRGKKKLGFGSSLILLRNSVFDTNVTNLGLDVAYTGLGSIGPR